MSRPQEVHGCWRGLCLMLLWLCAAPLAGNALAAGLQAGRDFRPLDPPLATETKDRIEVIEFFWYGCPHCFDFEPTLEGWAKTLPADVVLRRVPAIFHSKWAPGAQLYYTLEALHLADALHHEVFTAMHVERLRLDDESVLFGWAARQGIAAKAFAAAWNSFGVQSRVREAQRLTQESRITGVPALVVGGRYQALTSGNYGDLLQNTAQLIIRVRGEQPATEK